MELSENACEGLSCDVTRWFEVVARLRRSEETFRALIESTPDGILVARGDELVYVNPAAVRLLAYSNADDLLRQTPTDLIRRKRPSIIASEGSRATIAPSEISMVRRDGSTFVADLQSLELVFDGHASTLLIARDITERRQLEAQLYLADRMTSIGVLAAGIGHEINNPLAYVMANLAFVTDELSAMRSFCATQTASADPRVNEWVSHLQAKLDAMMEAISESRQGADRVRQIVRDLKTFSRNDEATKKPVDVMRILESSLNVAANEIRHRAQIVREYKPIPRVEANEGRLGQVFLNVLVNAAQAIPEGDSGNNYVRVATFTDAEARAVIEISDTGSGISEESVNRIFDPFFTTKPVGIGTGLGLAICHSIVSGMGGEIRVVCSGRDGTTLQIRLPPAFATTTSNTSLPPAIRPGYRRAKVLVIDDELMMGRAVQRLLEAEHDVITFTRPEDALDVIRAGEQFDLILCDLMMPSMGGMDVHAAVTKIAPDLVERIVFMTGGAFSERAQAFLDVVPNMRLRKPLDRKDLQNLIRDRL